jgi:amidase
VTADPLGALVPGWEPPAEAVGRSGQLDGLTVVVKDVIDVAGAVTGGGNPDWAAEHEPATRSAAAVTALTGAGARPVAKGQCAELAFSLSGDNVHFGMPRNPAAPDRDPGGSTSGPAAAVAGGLCQVGLGTDTLGSIRVPASYCGIYGFRPTHGAIPVDGVMPLAQTFDTVGVLADRIERLQGAVEVLLGSAAASALPLSRLLVSEVAFASAEPAVADAARAAAHELAKRIGATVGDTEVLDDAPSPAEGMEAFNVLQGAQVWRNYGEWVERTSPSLGPDIAARLERASGYAPADVEEAAPVAKAVRNVVADLEAAEALVLPTTGTPAPGRQADAEERERARLSAGQLTSIATLAGAPAITLPLLRVDGLPVGLSLVGAPGSDLSLLSVATSAVRAGPS